MIPMNRRTFATLTAGAFAARAVRAAEISPIIETASGKVRGFNVGKVKAFRGIPYGASTAGAGRFQPPAQAMPWAGVRDALELGLRAPQLPASLVPEMGVMDRTEPMGEDCLMLNVWSQGLRDGRKRPVMVWLHGGGFTNGSAGFYCYDGANLAAKHDVVVVGVNHRLNIFGFLHLADVGGAKYAHATNAGMLDCVQALQWVRENIEAFGGDPANVTVFGQSGGGSKVSTLLGMPAAKGLFHRAIAMSGSQVTSVPREQATETTRAVMKMLNITRAEDLEKVPMQTLLDLTAGGTGGGQGNPNLRLTPTMDGTTIPAHIFDPVATAISIDVPLMIGSTETEVTWNTRQQYDPLDDAELGARVKQTARTTDAGAAAIVAAYRKNRPRASNLDLYLIFASDVSNFRTGTDTEAERKAAQGKGNVYKYYFQWYSPVRDGRLRSMHTMDIPFVFENTDVARALLGDGKEKYALADRMSAAWVQFARTGNPSHKGLPQWTPFENTKRSTMILNNECRLEQNPFHEERAAVAAAPRQGKASA